MCPARVTKACMRRVTLLVVLAVAASAGIGAAADPGATLQDDEYEATQDATVTFTMELADADRATLRVGSEAAGYTLDAAVNDTDGDGQVRVRFDVAAAGTNDTTVSGVRGDEVVNVTETDLDAPPLDGGQYEVSVHAAGEQTDAATLRVREDREPDAAFRDSTLALTTDDTVNVTVNITDTMTADFSFDGDESAYRFNASVHDDDGDGTVVLQFDPSAVATDAQAWTALGPDSMTVRDRHVPADGLTVPGFYAMAVGATDTDDLGQLYLRQADATTTSTTETTTSTTQSMTSPSTTPTSNDETAPGFGVGAAAVAVTAAAGIAARRY
jgi:hypothetical protein